MHQLTVSLSSEVCCTRSVLLAAVAVSVVTVLASRMRPEVVSIPPVDATVVVRLRNFVPFSSCSSRERMRTYGKLRSVLPTVPHDSLSHVFVRSDMRVPLDCFCSTLANVPMYGKPWL